MTAEPLLDPDGLSQDLPPTPAEGGAGAERQPVGVYIAGKIGLTFALLVTSAVVAVSNPEGAYAPRPAFYIVGVAFVVWGASAAGLRNVVDLVRYGTSSLPVEALIHAQDDSDLTVDIENVNRPFDMTEQREERLRNAFAQLVEAIFALHGQGILHRDIKPSNVMVTLAADERVYSPW